MRIIIPHPFPPPLVPSFLSIPEFVPFFHIHPLPSFSFARFLRPRLFLFPLPSSIDFLSISPPTSLALLNLSSFSASPCERLRWLIFCYVKAACPPRTPLQSNNFPFLFIYNGVEALADSAPSTPRNTVLMETHTHFLFKYTTLQTAGFFFLLLVTKQQQEQGQTLPKASVQHC